MFRNCPDALYSAFLLIFLPFTSILYVVFTNGVGFWEYAFPLVSITTSGLADAASRLEHNAKRNPKLIVRMVYNLGLTILTMALSNSTQWYIRIIPSALLVLLGLLIANEILTIIVRTIEISVWASKRN